MKQIKLIFKYSILVIFFVFSLTLKSQESDHIDEDVADISLDDLLNVKITSASKFKESISDTPASILVITRKDIEDRGYNSLPEIFADLPGMDVIVAYGDVHQLIYARGNSTGSFNERTMLMIDGVEHNVIYTQHMNIDNDFPITSIERIEILYGPASAVYGPNAFSGIINIITRSPQDLPSGEDRITAHLSAGSFNTRAGEMTYLAKHGPFGLSLSYKRYSSDRFDISNRPGYYANGTIIGNPDIWGPFAEYYPEYDNRADNYSLLTKLTFNSNLELGFNRLSTNQGNGGVYPYDKALPTTNWKFEQSVFHLRYMRDLTRNLQWNFLTTFQKGGCSNDSDFAQGSNDGPNWSDTRTVEILTWKFICSRWTFFQDLIFKPADNWIISGGLKYASGIYQKGYEFGMADQVTFEPGDREYDYETLFPHPVNTGLTPGNTFKDSEWGVFLQTKWTSPDRKFNLVAGARYDDNSIYGDTFNPRFGATYQLSKKLLLKTNYGTAFQAPSPRNVGGSWGGLSTSTALKPDEIKTIDLSILSTSKYFAHDWTFFRNVVTGSILQGQNLPKKTMIGFEYKFNFVFPELGNNIKNFKIHLNYSFIDAKYDKALSNELTGRSSDKVGSIAKHKLNFILDADFFKNIHAGFKLNYIGKRPTIVSNPIAEVDPFIITNFNLQYRNILKHVTLFISIYNVFDVDYYHPGYDSASAGEDTSHPSTGWYSSRLPQPGRSFIVGATIDF